MPSQEEIQEAADVLAEAERADILIFNGPTNRTCVHKFISFVIKRKRRKRVILILVTSGGDADAAYRMARTLQSGYEHVTVFVPGWCKSAGTLLAIGAHRIVMSAFAELGPLDVQLGKRDDLFEYASGLDIDSAMKQLEVLSFSMFEDVLLAIEHSSGNRITFKTASHLSAEIVTSLFGNLYSQIDPIRIGETTRLMTIAKDYGERLASKSKNFARPDGLDLLVSSYSSHGFVIDFEEASTIFKSVEHAGPHFVSIMEALGDYALYPIESTEEREYITGYLNKEMPDETEPSGEAGASDISASNRTGNANADGPAHNHPDTGPANATPGDPAGAAQADGSGNG